ncbi:tetratricopeptide repeat protein [Streptomyces longisporoflavus]|uniref:tetratricopeptide repeat protein n=1 Tax=Streptomyces longisporoflavus TaxID=28044 RepID=UPI00167F099A
MTGSSRDHTPHLPHRRQPTVSAPRSSPSETAIHVIKGHPEFVFLDELRRHPEEIRIHTAPGDYIFVPPYVPHREENPSPDIEAVVVIARSTQEAIVVNLPGAVRAGQRGRSPPAGGCLTAADPLGVPRYGWPTSPRRTGVDWRAWLTAGPPVMTMASNRRHGVRISGGAMARSRRGVSILGAVVSVGGLAVLLAVPGVLQSAGISTPWMLATGVLVAGAGGAFTDLVKRRLERTATDREVVLDGCVRLPGDKRLPLVGDIDDPTLLGVRPSWSVDTGPPSPPYVQRDVHEGLVAQLQAGKFVLLVGDRLSGTTRTAYEAVRAALPGHTLIAPTSPAVDKLRAVIEHAKSLPRAVVWLDDLDQYLVPEGLTFQDIRHLVAGGHQRTIMATIKISNLYQLQSDASFEAREAKRVLRDPKPVPLACKLTTSELDRARALTADERIGAALRPPREFGLAEYIGAGLPLFDRWRNASGTGAYPRGASLVSAAVDCRRLGLTRPLAREMLEELHTHYLAHRPRLQPEPVAEAWDWALKQHEGTLSLLMPSTPHSESAPLDVFRYLVDASEREDSERATGPEWVPDDLCTRVLALVAPDEAEAIASTAHSYGRYATVRSAFRHAIDQYSRQGGSGDERTLAARFGFARWLHVIGEFAEAEEVVRAVLGVQRQTLGADHPGTLAGRQQLALLLFERGQREAAVAECESVLARRIELLGEAAPETLESRIALTAMQERQESPHTAAARLRADTDARTADPDLGPGHSATLTSRLSLAIALWQLGQPRQAQEECRLVLEGRRRALGHAHCETLEALGTLSSWRGQAGDAAGAAAGFAELLAAQERTLRQDHPSLRETRGLLAYWLERAAGAEAR